VELAAVCDLDAERARVYREKFGFGRAYVDMAEMLQRESLDGLLVISPVALTEPLVSALLPRRIPLLIEKPPGKNSDSTARLHALARRHQTPHMVSFNRRYGPALQQALGWIAEAPVARRPLFVLARMLRHRRREPEFAIETGIHLVDAVLSILGAPMRVSTGRILEAPASHSPGTIAPEAGCYHYSVRITFTGGAQADLIIAPDSGANEETYEIHGREYCIQVDHMNCVARIWERNAEVLSWKLPPEAESVERDGTLGEMEAFLAFLENPSLRVPTLSDGLVAMRVVEAIATATESDFSASSANKCG
jgi:predicted dehydrogenase